MPRIATTSPCPPATPRLPADELAAQARARSEPGARLSLVFEADPAAPVAVSAGRGTVALLNPYTGAALADAAAGRRDFFETVEHLHRWMGGDSRSTAASLIDIANLMFLFLIACGIYLWLPDIWRWRTLRGLVLFRTKYINSKVRDYSWHHVFSSWALIPLFLIAFSGVVMSYPWANKLVFAAFGEQAPQRGGPAGGGAANAGGGQRERGNRPAPEANAMSTAGVSLQRLLETAIAQEASWRRITLPVQLRGNHVDVTVELQSTERRAPRRTLTLSTADASVLSAAARTDRRAKPGTARAQLAALRAHR